MLMSHFRDIGVTYLILLSSKSVNAAEDCQKRSDSIVINFHSITTVDNHDWLPCILLYALDFFD